MSDNDQTGINHREANKAVERKLTLKMKALSLCSFNLAQFFIRGWPPSQCSCSPGLHLHSVPELSYTLPWLQQSMPKSVPSDLTSFELQIPVSNWCWHFYLDIPRTHHLPKVKCTVSFLFPHPAPPQLVSILAHSFVGAAPWSRMPTPSSTPRNTLPFSQSQLK